MFYKVIAINIFITIRRPYQVLKSVMEVQEVLSRALCWVSGDPASMQIGPDLSNVFAQVITYEIIW